MPIVYGTIICETLKAIRIEPNQEIHGIPEEGADNGVWFPLSQVKKIMRNKVTSLEDDELTVTDWIMEQKDLLLATPKRLAAAKDKKPEVVKPPEGKPAFKPTLDDFDDDIPF